MGSAAADLSLFDAIRIHRDHGINVACAVLPFHGARAEGSGGSKELISSGIANMMHCHAQAVWDIRSLLSWVREQGGELRLSSLNEDLRTLFELTKLDTLFRITDTKEEALEGF